MNHELYDFEKRFVINSRLQMKFTKDWNDSFVNYVIHKLIKSRPDCNFILRLTFFKGDN